ncbi:hypothetical protein KSS87_011308 [Heliosperma pusillum]|nr:hypothetical protein KSS87_011308 [Heliosperma pusillum]
MSAQAYLWRFSIVLALYIDTQKIVLAVSKGFLAMGKGGSWPLGSLCSLASRWLFRLLGWFIVAESCDGRGDGCGGLEVVNTMLVVVGGYVPGWVLFGWLGAGFDFKVDVEGCRHGGDVVLWVCLRGGGYAVMTIGGGLVEWWWAVAYIPLTVLAVPASVLTLGGGYLFGLPLGFIADSVGATIGATVAFLLGRTIGKSYVMSKLKNYPKFHAVAIAIQRSGFKIVFLLRLVPLLPFSMLNYLLSVTPVSLGAYMLATWLGMMPITFAFVYVGTTLKDLSDVTHGWNDVSTTRLVFIGLGLLVSVALIMCVMRVAKASLDKALAENGDLEGILASEDASKLPIVSKQTSDLWQPLVIKIDSSRESFAQ